MDKHLWYFRATPSSMHELWHGTAVGNGVVEMTTDRRSWRSFALGGIVGANLTMLLLHADVGRCVLVLMFVATAALWCDMVRDRK